MVVAGMKMKNASPTGPDVHGFHVPALVQAWSAVSLSQRQARGVTGILLGPGSRHGGSAGFRAELLGLAPAGIPAGISAGQWREEPWLPGAEPTMGRVP